MSSVGASLGSVSASISAGTTPLIRTLSMPLANTEYSMALSPNVKQIPVIQARPNANIRMSYVVGETATNYVTLPGGTSRSIENIDAAALTLYFRSDQAGTILVVEEWT